MTAHPRRPAVGAATVFLLGVIAGTLLGAADYAVPLVVTLPLMALVRRGRAVAWLLLLALFLVGGWHASSRGKRLESRHSRLVRLLGAVPVEGHVVGRVVSAPQTTARGERSFRLRGRLERDADMQTFRVLAQASRSSGANRRVDGLRRGDVVRCWGRIRIPDPPRAEIHVGVKSTRLVEPIACSAGALAALDRMRAAARARLDALLGEATAERALAGAMLLGDRRQLDAERADQLRRSGLAHLVAISGLHVGLLVGMLCGLAGRLRGIGPSARLVAGVVVITWLAATVHEQASVLRATLGAAVWLSGRRWGRAGDPLNTLALIAAGLAAYDPTAVTAVGFQLTFVATAGLIVGCGDAGGIRGLAPVRVSTVAYVATSPLVAWHFGRLAPIGILANLVALPLAAVLLGSGYLAILWAPFPALAIPLAAVTEIAAAGILSVARSAAALESWGWIVPAPPPVWIVAHYVVALTVMSPPVVFGASHAKRRVALGALVLSTVSMHVGMTGPAATSSSLEDRAAVLDVGQGLAVAVRSSGGGTALVDAGGSYRGEWDPGARVVVPWVLRNWGRRVDAVLVSHDDVDHAGGLRAVLRDLEVGSLWVGPDAHRSPRSRALIFEAHDRGVAVTLAERGSRGRARRLRWHIVSPPRGPGLERGNERSLVTRFGQPPHRLLVAGDIGGPAESGLVETGADLEAEVLVLSHHGSRDGSSPRFLRRVDCRWAIASVGRNNRFGHPHAEVIERLRTRGVRLLRTDRCGTIELAGAAGQPWRVQRP